MPGPNYTRDPESQASDGTAFCHKAATVVAVVFLLSTPAVAQDKDRELAKKLANPLAALISVPMQLNYDKDIGPDDDGSLWQLNIQPVIPFSLSRDWLLISRTIISLSDQDDIPTMGDGDSGLGDILQSFFFSPSESTQRGWIWGTGPVLLLPTASDDALGTEKWSAGPTAVALKQQGPGPTASSRTICGRSLAKAGGRT